MENNQLNPVTNKWDFNRIQKLCQIFFEAESELGTKLLGSLTQLDSHKLSNFYSTARNKFNTSGTYNNLSKANEDTSEVHSELLDEIEFVWKDKVSL